jgi:two-component system sensor histidine kinase RegB
MSADQRSREAINFSWLVRLRWAAIAGQLATIVGVTRLFEVRLPLVELGIVLTIEAMSNIACALAARRGRPAEWWSGGVMMADTLLLTALLYLTGGAYNPFSFFYLVQIALAAVILSARWVWPLVLLSLAGSGILFVAPSPLEGLSHAQHMALHLRGMWVAFSVAAVTISRRGKASSRPRASSASGSSASRPWPRSPPARRTSWRRRFRPSRSPPASSSDA